MDEVARHIGISKTVLYRYFGDRSDLAGAVAESFIQTSLMPQLSEALTDDLDDYELVRTVIGIYVRIVTAEPSLYRYCVSTDRSSPGVLATAQHVFTGAIESTLRSRLTERAADTGGSVTWALAMVGGVETAVGRWLDHPHTDVGRLADELTMLLWGGVAGIIHAGGSPARFTAQPPTIPPIYEETT